MKHKILVVDDEAHIRKILCFKLEHSGYYVESVTSGRHAMDALTRFTPDLIITDLRMPGDMTGMDVIRAVRNIDTHAHTPIILLTGSVAVPEKLNEQLGETEGVHILSKPFSPKELARIVNEQLS